MKLRNILSVLLLSGALTASAQIGEIVNGLTNVVMPAIRQGMGYKGYVEADYTQGFGNYRCNFATIATSQGYQFTNWFYLGAGIGVDLLWSTVNAGWSKAIANNSPQWQDHEKTNCAVMIPIFTDFRFIINSQSQPSPLALSFFANVRVGAAFLCTDNYVAINNGYLTNQNYFYLQPAFGVRIPINQQKPRQAMDIGIHYRLMTSEYWSGWQRIGAINGVGLDVSYEW